MNWMLIRDIHMASLRVPPYSADMSSADEDSILEAVTSLANQGRLNKLECISFNGCIYLKDNTLDLVLAKCLVSVKIIDICGCALIDDEVEGWGQSRRD